MADLPRDELRALIFETVSEVVTSAVAGLQKHLDEQILQLQVDVDTALGKDVRSVQRQEAKLTREWMTMGSGVKACPRCRTEVFEVDGSFYEVRPSKILTPDRLSGLWGFVEGHVEHDCSKENEVG